MPKYVVPQTFQCPKVIRLCHSYYFPDQRTMINYEKEILFTITAESINQMLQIQSRPDQVPLSIEALTQLYLNLDFPKRFQIFHTFMPSSIEIPKINPPYPSAKFSERARHIISIMSFILGYFTYEHVDVAVLDFLSTFTHGQPPSTIFNFSQYLADNIHEQLVKMPFEGVFKYSSVLFHMFLYFQSEKFALNLQKLDVEGNPQLVIFWTPLIRKYSSQSTYIDFIDSFIHPMVNLLNSSRQPRISEEIKKVLQFSEHNRTGDWYLYQNHIEIRVYGSNLIPYKLSKYLPMRLFSLEYIRHIINSDTINFLVAKKKTVQNQESSWPFHL